MKHNNTQKSQDLFLGLEMEMKKYPLDLDEIERIFRYAIRTAVRTEDIEVLEKILSKTKALISLGGEDNIYKTFVIENVLVLLTHTNPMVRISAAMIITDIIADATKTDRIKMKAEWLL